MAIVFVRAAALGGSGTAATTRTATLAAAVGANGFVCGVVTWGSGTTTDLTSISDNASGNPNAAKYVVIDRVADATNGQCAAQFYGWNLTGGPTQITANFGASLTYTGISVQEHSGVDSAADPLDGANHQGRLVAAPGTGTDGLSSGTGTQTPSVAGCLVFGGGVDTGALNAGTGSEFAAGTGFTEPTGAEHQVGGDISLASEYQIQTTAAAVNAAWTVTQNTPHVALQAVFKPAGAGGGSPTITGTSSATPQRGAAHTVTGSGFGATQSTKQLRVGGVVQTPTSWADGSITYTLAADLIKSGIAVNVEIWETSPSDSLLSNSFALTSIQPAAGWSYIDVGTPNTTAANRLTFSADAASGDQAEWFTGGGASVFTVNSDLTVTATGYGMFAARLWTPTDGYGASAVQNITALNRYTGAWGALGGERSGGGWFYGRKGLTPNLEGSKADQSVSESALFAPLVLTGSPATLAVGGNREPELAGGAVVSAGAVSLAVGGNRESEQPGGAAFSAGAVSLAVGGSAETERAGGATLSSVVSLAVGGNAESQVPGGAQAQAGAVSLAVGGNAERESAGGAQAQAGAVSLALGGAVEAERAGGVAAVAGGQTVSVGGTVEQERAGGAAATPGAVTLAVGGAAEREQAGGVIVGAGVQVLSLGGVAEREQAGGAQIAAGAVTVSVGGALERELAGGMSAQAGAQTISVGGNAEGERAGGATLTAGAITLQVGGNVEREQAGGIVAQPGVMVIAVGGNAERELAGGVSITITAVVLNLGGTAETETAGGAALRGSDVTLQVGGSREAEVPGGAVVIDRTTVDLTEELLTAVLRTVCPRVSPDVAPLSTARPYITYQAIGGQAWRYVDLKAADKRHTMMQINVWADTRRQARDLIQAVEDALCAATTFVAWPMGEAMSDSTDLGDRTLYGSLQDFEIVADR